MNEEQKAALERLFAIAIEHDTGTSARVANFLLAWWNARENGGFDFTDFWGFDPPILTDCWTVLAYVATHREYHEAEFGEQFGRVVQLWRKPKRKRRA